MTHDQLQASELTKSLFFDTNAHLHAAHAFECASLHVAHACECAHAHACKRPQSIGPMSVTIETRRRGDTTQEIPPQILRKQRVSNA